MPVAQSAYREDHNVAFAGMIANPQTCDFDSLEWFGSRAGQFGYACQQGATPERAIAGIAAGTFRGILAIDRTRQPGDEDTYVAGVMATVMWRGDIWVPVESAVVAGNDVSADTVTGQLSSAAAASTQIVIAGARWMTSQATAGGLARVRLSGYQAAS